MTLARAMTASAAAAALSGVFSVAATKIIAVFMGPASLALLATLQQIRQTALTAATSNGQTALVQGASSMSGAARAEYVRTVAAIFTAGTALVATALAFAPTTIAQWAGLKVEAAPLVRWLSIAVALSSLYGFQYALINAAGAIGRLALLQLVGPAAMALLAWPVTRGMLGFPAMLAISAAVCVTASLGGAGDVVACFSWTRVAARHFFSMSTAMLLTGLIASTAVMVVRGKILRGQGLATAGQFDAAWNISMNQVTLVLASLQTYYLPTLARLRTAEERGTHIARVLTMAAPVAACIIAVIALNKTALLRLFYSPAFLEAARYLRWTLVGDYLKVTSWILSVPMLAAADMRIFLASDLTASGVFVASAALAVRWRSPAESAAIAFVLMHVAHLAIGAWYVHQKHAFRWRGPTATAWIAGLLLVGTVFDK